MKKKLIIYAFILFAVVCITSCKKNVINHGAVELIDDTKALLKFNYASQYSNNRSVYIKINDQRISNLITGRTPFPGGGYNTGGASTPDFLGVTAGNLKISIGLPHKPDNGTDSLILFSTNINVAGGKRYSVHITDTAATTKTVLTEENFAMPDTATARYRFINLMPNVPAIDLWFGSTAPTAADQSTDSLVVSNAAYLTITPEFKMRAGVSRYWKIRAAGAAKTAATVLASYTSTSSVANRRVYTAFASGYSGKTGTQKPYISFYLIR